MDDTSLPLSELRDSMVKTQIQARGVSDARILAAMRSVPRHLFVPEPLRRNSYCDCPLSIGFGQTISQPYIVALMSELLDIRPTDRILEIGTGSGYQTAVLSMLAREVCTIEWIGTLQNHARSILAATGYANIRYHHGDGSTGWPEDTVFDGILVTCAPDRMPAALTGQIALDRHIVIPVGTVNQNLMVYTRTRSGIESRFVIPVRFVPMVSGDSGSLHFDSN